MMKLNMEELERVNGGTWSYETLTAEERAEYDELSVLFFTGDVTADELHSRVDPFLERLDAKYGPNV